MASAIPAKRSDRQLQSGSSASTPRATAEAAPSPAGSGIGVRALGACLKGWIMERLATEHCCAPPGAAGFWVQVAACDASAGADPADAYVCPECGRHWHRS
ncbi:MAG: hypothetical protein JNL45_13135 [Hyphomicrobium sp.]|nr:hypothetical protein [Hyphomicrobium sp.]